MGLSLECWLYHTQLDEVVQLADAHPELAIILNYVGSPILGGPYQAKKDEVFCLSGVLPERQPEIVEYLDTWIFNSQKCFAIFSPQ